MALKKIFLGIFIIGLAVAFLAAAAGYLWFKAEITKSVSLTKPQLFIINKGQGVSAIADKLSQNRIIDHALVLQLAARLQDNHTSLQAGEYRIEPGMTISSLLQLFSNGQTYQRQITIPEGLTSWQILQILQIAPAMEGNIETMPDEGSLMPETYNYQYGDSRHDIALRMQNAMRVFLDQAWEGRENNLPLKSKEEALILASIVEKETGVGGERKKVAGVFINRLRKGMKLQSDPTVIYGLTGGQIQNEGQGPLGRRLLRKDLEHDSPYNSYKYAGLPPGPIANPGRSSIEAVLHPEAHDFIYFVADGSGGHAFAKTLDGHNSNVAKWRKIRRAKEKAE